MTSPQPDEEVHFAPVKAGMRHESPSGLGAAGTALTLTRDASFGAAVMSAIAAIAYPMLPKSIQAAVPLVTWQTIAFLAGALLQRGIYSVWQTALGPFARKGKYWLTTHLRLLRVQHFARIGAISPARARRLTAEIVEADLRRGLKSGSAGDDSSAPPT